MENNILKSLIINSNLVIQKILNGKKTISDNIDVIPQESNLSKLILNSKLVIQNLLNSKSSISQDISTTTQESNIKKYCKTDFLELLKDYYWILGKLIKNDNKLLIFQVTNNNTYEFVYNINDLDSFEEISEEEYECITELFQQKNNTKLLENIISNSKSVIEKLLNKQDFNKEQTNNVTTIPKTSESILNQIISNSNIVIQNILGKKIIGGEEPQNKDKLDINKYYRKKVGILKTKDVQDNKYKLTFNENTYDNVFYDCIFEEINPIDTLTKDDQEYTDILPNNIGTSDNVPSDNVPSDNVPSDTTTIPDENLVHAVPVVEGEYIHGEPVPGMEYPGDMQRDEEEYDVARDNNINKVQIDNIDGDNEYYLKEFEKNQNNYFRKPEPNVKMFVLKTVDFDKEGNKISSEIPLKKVILKDADTANEENPDNKDPVFISA